MSITIAVIAIVTGFILLLTTLYSARSVNQKLMERSTQKHIRLDKPEYAQITSDAVIIAQLGGQIQFINDKTRHIFGIDNDWPNLTQMARLVEPMNAFYELFSIPSTSRFKIREQVVEGTSVEIPYEGESTLFVILKESQAIQYGSTVAGESLPGALQAPEQVGPQIILDSLLSTVSQSYAFDVAHLHLYNPEDNSLNLVSETGNRAYVIAVNSAPAAFQFILDTPKKVLQSQNAIVFNEQRHLPGNESFSEYTQYPVRSVICVPIRETESQPILGTLTLSAQVAKSFQKQDVPILEEVTSNYANALSRAFEQQRKEQRLSELNGLLKIAQSSAYVSDKQELISSLTDQVADLLNVSICGILLLNPTGQLLIGQQPFQGIPEIFLGSIRVVISDSGDTSNIWRTREYWHFNDAKVDPNVQKLGLTEIVNSFGISTGLFVPLVAQGRHIGAILAANKKSDEVFSDTNGRKLVAFAGQAAALLENSRLVEVAQQRALRAESMRNIALTTSSSLPVDEILRQSIAEVTHMLGADAGLIMLLDATRGALEPQLDTAFGIEQPYKQFANIKDTNSGFKQTATASDEVVFKKNVTDFLEGTSETYHTIQQSLQSEALIAVPLRMRGRTAGELIISSHTSDTLLQDDIPLISVIATNISAALEQNHLNESTDTTLHQRVEQLSALTRISRELNQTLELSHLLQAVYDEAVRSSNATGGYIGIIDPHEDVTRFTHRIGDVPATETIVGLEKDVFDTSSGRLIKDYRQLNELPIYENEVSALLVPIKYQAVTVGLIHLYQRKPNMFDVGMLEFTQALADNAAIAFGNANRYQDQIQRGELLRQKAEQLTQLLQISRTIRSDQPLPDILDAIAQGISEAGGFKKAIINQLDVSSQELITLTSLGLPAPEAIDLVDNPRKWGPLIQWLQKQTQISQSYFIVGKKVPKRLQNHIIKSDDDVFRGNTDKHWQSGDLLLVPMHGAGGQILGTIVVAEPTDGIRPTRSTVETLEIFGNQAALAIENATLLKESEERAAQEGGIFNGQRGLISKNFKGFNC